MLNLKTRDAATRPSGAGHVVADGYVRELDTWVLVDGQFDAVVSRGGLPPHAAEVRDAVQAGGGVEVRGFDAFAPGRAGYLDWLEPYLSYIGVAVDRRYGVPKERGGVMLGPVGGEGLTVFQDCWPIRHMPYTYARSALYDPPGGHPSFSCD